MGVDHFDQPTNVMRLPVRDCNAAVLASIASRSSFLIGELLLGKISKTVIVQGNAPHDRASGFVGVVQKM